MSDESDLPVPILGFITGWIIGWLLEISKFSIQIRENPNLGGQLLYEAIMLVVTPTFLKIGLGLLCAVILLIVASR